MRYAVLLFLVAITVSCTCGKCTELAPMHVVPSPTLGTVYVWDHGRPSSNVLRLLTDIVLQGDPDWIENAPLQRPEVQALGCCESVEEIEKVRKHVVWTAELIGSTGTLTQIRGPDEMLQVLNRSLTGDLIERNQEIRTAQLQQQMSAAIADCGKDQSIVVCTGVKTVVDPHLRVRARLRFWETGKPTVTVEQAARAAKRFRDKFNLKGEQVEGPDTNGYFVLHIEGEVPCKVAYRKIKDADPRFGRDRLFFMTDLLTTSLSEDDLVNQAK